MIIRRLTIRNFGKIKDCTLKLSDGINVLYGKNESGKTTFYHFLKSMFYGVPRKRGRGAKSDMYALYEPWEDPVLFGGLLWFEACGSEYRLRRNFYREKPEFELLNETEGRLLAEEELDGLLCGVSEAIYENTVSIGQLRSAAGPDLARELTNYMAACQGAADSRVSLDRAIQLLKMQRKGFLEQKERAAREMAKDMAKLEGQEEYLKQELGRVESRISSLIRKKEEFLSRYADLPDPPGEETDEEEEGQSFKLSGASAADPAASEEESLKRQETRLRRLTGGLALGAAAAVILMAASLISGRGGMAGKLVLALAALGLIGGCLFSLERSRGLETAMRRREDRHRKEESRQKKKKAALEKMALRAKELSRQRKEILTTQDNLAREKMGYEETLHLPRPQDDEVEAINLAIERIQEASGAIKTHLGERLRRRTSQILEEVTEGKYKEILVNEDFHVSVNLEDRMIDLERLSRGTVEQIYFALRMASGEILCGGNQFPVILDDVFGMYDEERLGAVLRWLEKQNRQVIICTCSKREEETMLAEGIAYVGFEL